MIKKKYNEFIKTTCNVLQENNVPDYENDLSGYENIQKKDNLVNIINQLQEIDIKIINLFNDYALNLTPDIYDLHAIIDGYRDMFVELFTELANNTSEDVALLLETMEDKLFGIDRLLRTIDVEYLGTVALNNEDYLNDDDE